MLSYESCNILALVVTIYSKVSKFINDQPVNNLEPLLLSSNGRFNYALCVSLCMHMHVNFVIMTHRCTEETQLKKYGSLS